jgi:hypothetical protein
MPLTEVLPPPLGCWPGTAPADGRAPAATGSSPGSPSTGVSTGAATEWPLPSTSPSTPPACSAMAATSPTSAECSPSSLFPDAALFFPAPWADRRVCDGRTLTASMTSAPPLPAHTRQLLGGPSRPSPSRRHMTRLPGRCMPLAQPRRHGVSGGVAVGCRIRPHHWWRTGIPPTSTSRAGNHVRLRLCLARFGCALSLFRAPTALPWGRAAMAEAPRGPGGASARVTCGPGAVGHELNASLCTSALARSTGRWCLTLLVSVHDLTPRRACASPRAQR